MKRVLALSPVLILLLVVAGCSGGQEGKEKDIYFCSMDGYISDIPGDCPICNMQLKKLDKGQKLPEMTGGVPGMAAVQLPRVRQQMINLRTEKVVKRFMEKEIRTVGRVEYDERKVAWVNTKYSGWIEEIHADYTGKKIEKDEPLLAIYSPDLVATQEELITALQGKETAEKSGVPQIALNSNRLYESARQKLLYWDISEDQIKAIETSRAAAKRMTVVAPIGGHIIEKEALLGKFIAPGENLYKIADLSTIWITADIYEYELPFIHQEQTVTVELSYYPGEVFTGRVAYIYPYLNTDTRTARIRIEFPNDDGKLKPGMFANVTLTADLGEKLSIPADAVLDTGTRQVVFVGAKNDYFEPRAVKLGAKIDNYYEVLDGVYEGDFIVSSGTFLLDSESKHINAIARMITRMAEGKQPEHQQH